MNGHDTTSVHEDGRMLLQAPLLAASSDIPSLLRSPQESEEEEASQQVDSEQARLQTLTLRILGRPYACHCSFWIAWLLSALLGCLLGLCILAFFGLSRLLLQMWFPEAHHHHHPEQLHLWSGDWRWLWVTTGGGFLSGLVHLFPKAPRVGAARNMFHDAIDLRGNIQEAPYVLLACFISLSCGASLGPEMALGAMGSCLGTLISQVLCTLDKRSRASLVLSGMAGSLGVLFPSPLLGVLIVHELSVVGRPNGLLLNTLAADEQPENSSDDPTAVSINVGKQQPLDHDFVEQLTLAGTAAAVTFVIMRVLGPSESFFEQRGDVDLSSSDFEQWHLAAAIPIGMLCGLVGSMFVILTGIVRTLRCKVVQIVKGSRAWEWMSTMLLLTTAGFLYGVIAVAYPLTLGSGLHFVRDLVQNEFDSEATSISPHLLQMTILWKIVSTATCLGLGLVGGQIIPMVYVGVCLGFLLPRYIPAFPASVTVPCCMAACVGSFLPIPFTLIFFTSLVLNVSAEMMGPVMVATVVAYLLTGGLGVLRMLGGKREASQQTDDDVAEEETPIASQPSDVDLLRGVHSAIFGK